MKRMQGLSSKKRRCKVEMPADLLAEMFVRLPLESLTRCKCLSKYWNDFISFNSSFRQAYLDRSSFPPLTLGFFFNRAHMTACRRPVRFLPTCDQGDQLMSWGHFDQSLRFLGHDEVFIVASSNGFLLCRVERFDPMTYFICNPLTKQFLALPKPTLTRAFVPTGFICQTHHKDKDGGLSYVVVRAFYPTNPSNTLTLEIFSSDLPEWNVLSLTCPCYFYLEETNPCVVIDEDGVVYWSASRDDDKDNCYGIVMYDPRKTTLQFIAAPRGSRWTDRFALWDGLIVYARHDRHQLEIWILHDRNEWSLKSRVSLDRIKDRDNIVKGCRNCFRIIGFHPSNPALLFIKSDEGKMATFDSDNSNIELVCDLAAQGWASGYFFYQYVWPSWPPFFV